MPPKYSKPYKKYAKKSSKKSSKKTATPKLSKTMYSAVNKIVAKKLNKVIETKKAVYSTADGTEITHNNFIVLDSNPLFTSQGTADPNVSDTQCRIGDKILSKGMKLKFFFELNERYSDVTFRIMMVRSARGDVPTRATLFCGISGNKMLDSVNTERYTIVAQKYFKMKAPNMVVSSTTGTTSEVSLLGQNAGIEYPAGNSYSNSTLSRATRMITMSVPGYKFGRKGVITYDSGGNLSKFYDYNLIVYAYSNYTTFQDVWNIARCNDYIRHHYFQDA